MLLGPLGSNGATAMVTTLTSMVGISLGILLGLAQVDRDPERARFGDMAPHDVAPPAGKVTPARDGTPA